MATIKEREKRDDHQELTNSFIEAMEKSEASKWQTPYFKAPPGRPYNVMTGTRPSGCNLLAIILSGYTNDKRWFTFKGLEKYAKQNNLEVSLKGETGVSLFKKLTLEIDKDRNGKKLEEPKKIAVMKKVGTVFNAQQIKGMPPAEDREKIEFDPIFAAEQLATAVSERTGVQIVHGMKGAYFSPTKNLIGIEHKEHFKSVRQYYDTLLHEIIHASGIHLERKMEGAFGTPSYAYEEFVAELGSCFLAGEIGIEHDQFSHDQHTAYFQSWKKALQGDKNLIFRASNAASRACNFQMEHLREYLYELVENQKATPEQENLLQAFGQPARIIQLQRQNEEQEEQQVLETKQEPTPQVLEIGKPRVPGDRVASPKQTQKPVMSM